MAGETTVANEAAEPRTEQPSDGNDDQDIAASPLSMLLEHPTPSDLDPQRVRDMFSQSTVWVLGFQTKGSEADSSEILHFTVDAEEGGEKVMLPAFTSIDALQKALLRNTDWQQWAVLEVEGGQLLPNLESDVTVIVNPWTPLEFVLPPRHESAGPQ